ncbi:TPR repeat-containing protein [Solidesulfovibrio fructosivorans JJ]]|uniref:TPR repeat-containing protein n=1 Tax=Solidesulfovibrio fructosivorans JJ] TaxID=596151 RepID=E1JVD8_SOLFR|nr:tetratricopeptide repeat protein [Solidesulfovibrio fructosivorans]EFL51732.1 TPR repeat-containing protein [Solidesulfovibrio fructosivorans JJ]]
MSEEKKQTTATVSRTAAILGGCLALLVGFYLGFTAHGMMGRQSGAPGVAQAPAPAQPAVDTAMVDRIKAIEKQTQLEPANTAAWTQLGNLYFDSHQPEKAIAAYEKSLTLDPRQPDVLTDQGVMYRDSGQFDKALASFDKAIAINPAHVIAYYNKSVVLEHDKHDKAGAIAALKILAAKNPNATLPSGQTVMQALQELSDK